jgi:glycosyltransferase involved in cell wall biosynthesis
MRVGIITDYVDEKAGGFRTYIKELVNCLKYIDHSTEYILIHHTKVDDDIYKENEDIVVPFKYRILRRELRKVFTLPIMLEKYGFDLIHETGHFGPFFIGAKFKKVLTVHDIAVLKYPETRKMEHIIKWRFAFPLILKNTDKIIAVSKNTKMDLIRYFNIPQEKIKVVYNGVSKRMKVIDEADILNRIRDKYNLPQKFILCVSTLEPRKNIPMLIKAYYRLKKSRYLTHKLILVGSKGWKYSNIFEAIKQLNLGRDVIFTGYVPDEDLPAIYNMADLFVYPSLYEGFGLPPLEAMACGTPVITSNTSSLPEVIGDAGIMIDPYYCDALTKAIYEVLTNEGLREDMTKKGFERARSFTWINTAKETLKVYEDIIDLLRNNKPRAN